MIIKQRDWALNECCCVDEYMFILSLSHMGMTVMLLGRQVIDSKLGGGVNGRGKFFPPLFSPGFQLVSPQSHTFYSSLTACDSGVIRPKNFKGGELAQQQPPIKDHQVEGLDPE